MPIAQPLNRPSIIKRLNRLFKRYDIDIRHKLAGASIDYRPSPSMLGSDFGYLMRQTWSQAINNFGQFDRTARGSDYEEMDMGEISTALDIYAQESATYFEDGQILHITSKNKKIEQILNSLFYDVLNIEFNLHFWIRNMCKYGDAFLLLDMNESNGIVNTIPVPATDIERLEGNDLKDPFAVEFRWIQGGNMKLEPWKVIHMRLLGKHKFLPYGSSKIDAARRIWRQLCHRANEPIWIKDYGYKEIKDVLPGDIVYSFDYEKNKLVESKVKHCFKTGTKKVYKVKTSSREVFVTPEHELLSYNVKIGYKYKKAIDLIQSGGEGGQTYRNADRLVLPVVDFGKEEIIVKLDPSEYMVRLKEKFILENYDIVNNLDELNIHGNLRESLRDAIQLDKKMPYVDFIELKKILNSIISYDDVDVAAYGCRHETFLNKTNLTFKITPEFARFFGFMLGDGWVGNGGTSVGFALGVHEDKNDYYISLIEKMFGRKVAISRKDGTFSAQANIFSKEAADFLKNNLGFITGFNKKIIPNWVFELNKNLRVEFIKGIVDADGYGEQGDLSLSNLYLINQVKILCQMSGVSCGSLVRVDRVGGTKYDKSFDKVVTRQDSYKLYINLKEITSESVKYEAVNHVTEENEEDVYDIEVETDLHNFVANGVVSHNCLLEDAMLLHRITRSPARRAFYVDVGGLKPDQVEPFMKNYISKIRNQNIVGADDSQIEKRLNPLDVAEDYFIPVRGGESGTRIETIEGQSWGTDIEDVNYIHDKLIASLGIPRAFLSYEEMLPSKATLSAEDIRFSRATQQIQKAIVSELSRIAIIHLYVMGYKGNQLVDFDIELNSPSAIYEVQKLELWRTRMEIAQMIPETYKLPKLFVYTNIYKLGESEVNEFKSLFQSEKIDEAEIEQASGGAGGTPAEGGGKAAGVPPTGETGGGELAPTGMETPMPENKANELDLTPQSDVIHDAKNIESRLAEQINHFDSFTINILKELKQAKENKQKLLLEKKGESHE